MQLNSTQITSYLQQHGLPQVLCIFGDAPLLVDDAVQEIRKFAKTQGIEERTRLLQDTQFDWAAISEHDNNLSLFSQLKLLELELPEAKPGREGGDALRRYVQAPPADQILVILGPKLKQEQQRAKWYKELSQAGPIIQANSPDRGALPGFIQHRAQRYQLQLDNHAVQLLASWFEGNLLALDQELHKLALMDLEQPLGAEQVKIAAQDQSRFNVFALQEALLNADLDTALHRLKRLFEGDVEAAILNWVLQREWQQLLALQMATPQNFSQACRQLGIWRNQEHAYQQFMQRMDTIAMHKAGELLTRLEYAFKSDSGEDYQTLATHLVTLYCMPAKVAALPQ